MARRPSVVAAVAVALTAFGAAQERPLPELQPFLKEARTRLQTDRRLLSQYTFLERSNEIHISKLGKVETGPLRVYQVYPGIPPVPTYRRLIEENGKPRSETELAKDDEEHRKKVLDLVAKREHESDADREKREARRAKARQEDEEVKDDLIRVYDFSMLRREQIGDRQAIVVAFAPKAKPAPKTDEGRLMGKVKGFAWVSEDDYQLARVEIEVLDDIGYGLGIVGKLYKGTTASYERRKVNDEVWLPAEMRIKASGRALIRKFDVDSVVRYSDYKKFSVETDTTFSVPKKPGG
jgi:hypothetical protein